MASARRSDFHGVEIGAGKRRLVLTECPAQPSTLQLGPRPGGGILRERGERDPPVEGRALEQTDRLVQPIHSMVQLVHECGFGSLLACMKHETCSMGA
jgi:hypothetical protein